MNPYLLPLSKEDFGQIIDRNMPRTVRLKDPSLKGHRAINWIHIAYDTKLIRKNEKLQQLLDETAEKQADPQVYQQLTPGQRFLVLLSVLDGQIKNGGIAQFFWNCPSLIIPIRETLQEFGMPELSKAFERAVKKLQDKFPEWEELRQKFDQAADEGAWEAFQESYELLDLSWFDDQYFEKHCWDDDELPDANQVVTLRLIEYVESHVEEFIIDP